MRRFEPGLRAALAGGSAKSTRYRADLLAGAPHAPLEVLNGVERNLATDSTAETVPTSFPHRARSHLQRPGTEVLLRNTGVPSSCLSEDHSLESLDTTLLGLHFPGLLLKLPLQRLQCEGQDRDEVLARNRLRVVFPDVSNQVRENIFELLGDKAKLKVFCLGSSFQFERNRP